MKYVLKSPNLRAGDRVHQVRVYDPPAFAGGGLAQVAELVRTRGRGGDEVLLHINPEEFAFLQREWGEPSTNPHTGLPEYGFFSKVKKALKFEKFNVKNIVKDIAKNPQRLLTGAVDPLGTKITNKMFGTHYDPVVNQLGGATEQRFQDAEARGIDTGMARDLHKVAGLVAGYYGGQGLGNLASEGLGSVSDKLATAAGNNPATLDPVVAGAGQTTVSPGVYDALQTASRAADTGAGMLSNATSKTADYLKNPKNWGQVAKAAGALGALSGAGASTAPAPPDTSLPGGSSIPFAPLNRTSRSDPLDYYTYGSGPEHQFFGQSSPDVLTPGTPDPSTRLKEGGILGHMGNMMHDNSRMVGHVKGPGTGRSDEIPARLSDGEYVMDAETVALLGDGSTDAGARRLDQLRRKLRAHKGKNLAKGKFSDNAKDPMQYLGEKK